MNDDKKKEHEHVEKSTMTEPQEEFISPESVPSHPEPPAPKMPKKTEKEPPAA